MPVMISMLRGINVGGHKIIRMDALRALYQSLGLEHAQSYVQSGNLVFRTQDLDVPSLSTAIENAIERAFGFRPAVILRTLSEFREVVAGNPFATRPDISPSKLLVTFFAGDPGQEARDKLLRIKAHREEIRVARCELYIYFPDGMGRSKLPMTSIDRALNIPGTGRNWNSVLKLLAMAEGLETIP